MKHTAYKYAKPNVSYYQVVIYLKNRYLHIHTRTLILTHTGK